MKQRRRRKGAWRKDYDDAANHINEIYKLEDKLSQVDWKDKKEEDYVLTRRRREERRAEIEKDAPDLRCPLCKKIVLNTKGWSKGKYLQIGKYICRGCYWKIKRERRLEALANEFDGQEKEYAKMCTGFLEGKEVRYIVDWKKFKESRKKVMSQCDFASLCKWSRTYQARLESGKIESINESAWNKINHVLRTYGIDVEFPDEEVDLCN